MKYVPNQSKLTQGNSTRANSPYSKYDSSVITDYAEYVLNDLLETNHIETLDIIACVHNTGYLDQ